MTEEKQKKLSYAMSEPSARIQLKEAKLYAIKAKSLIELYSCNDLVAKYRDPAVETLAEYLTNTRFYAEFLERQLQSDNSLKNKKTGTEQIVIDTTDFTIMNGYLIVMAACENELETLGISMQTH